MKRKLLRALGLVLTCGIALATMSSCGKKKGKVGADKDTPKKEGYNILWSDEFNGKNLNEGIWLREKREKGWTNNELQKYTADKKNGFIRDGKFVIKGYEEEVGSGDVTSTYSSCKLRNTDAAAFKYGRVEVSAKAPEGYGLWPAIWMMPKVQEKYGEWPRCGEIDIMEVLGDNVNKAYGTVHYGVPHAEQQGTVVLSGADSFADSFHTYAIEWEPGIISWMIDGKTYFVARDWFTAESETADEAKFPAPFDQEFCIQINLAIGGTWPGNPEPGADYIKNAEFEIDYVRVYQKDSYDENVSKPEKTYREPFEGGNYCKGFDQPLNPKNTASAVGWSYLDNAGGEGNAEIIEGNIVKITTNDKGTEDYSIQFLHTEMPFKKGKTYRISFEMWADVERTVAEICVDAPNAGWVRYWKEVNFNVTTEAHKSYTFEFTMDQKSDNMARFEFNMGGATSNGGTIYIANVSVVEVE